MSEPAAQRVARWKLPACSALIACVSCTPQVSAPSGGNVETAVPSLPICTRQQLLGLAPSAPEILQHRKFSLPTINLPFGTRQDSWGFTLSLLVDTDGRPACYRAADEFRRNVTLTGQRAALVAAAAQWRYRPFTRGGEPALAVVEEAIREVELPQRHREMPLVPLQHAHMQLRRSGCYGTCPSYSLDITGNGEVTYTGVGFVDVEGTYRFHIEPAVAAALVASARNSDLWSMRSEYTAPITDNPTYTITLTMGGQRHRIIDYVGTYVGMPPAVTEFENQLDTAANVSGWINLAMPTIDVLVANDFPFTSKEGAMLLDRAIRNREVTEEVPILRLMELGAPYPFNAPLEQRRWENPSQLEAALHNAKVQTAERLIQRGALLSDGELSQKKLDDAFIAAMKGGSLAAVQMAWDAGGVLRPSLEYSVPVGSDVTPSFRQPVSFLLEGRYNRARGESRQIAAWLSAHGVDLKARDADGETLLHLAAGSTDIAFVRDLLDLGLSPSATGASGYPPVGNAEDEAIAMLLLEAGTALPGTNKYNFDLRERAIDMHWARVVRWLDQNQTTPQRK